MGNERGGVDRSNIGSRPTRVGSIPTRTPSRVPTRGGRGPDKPAPHREALPAGTLLQGGAFRILDVIGAGGFSLTYVAEERSRRIQVAIKEMFPSGCVRNGIQVVPGLHWDHKNFRAALEDFVREGQVLKFFNHPSIVQCYSPFEENGTAYMAMELLQGESLLHQLGQRGAMNQHQALEVATQLGGALDLIHAGGIIHSDIKPENVIFTGEGKFVLLDFGVSRRYTPGRASKAAVVAISPGYSPPEQYQASKALTPATDIYSLAATLYTLLSMTVLPEAPLREKGVAIRSLRDVNPTVTAPFSVAIEEALELDPQRRPQSMEDFLSRLIGQMGQSSGARSILGGSAESFRTEKVLEFAAHRGGMHSLLLHTHHPVLVSGGRDGSAGLWSWKGESLGELAAHQTALCGFAISPDGILLGTAGQPGEVKLWNIADGQMLLTLRSGMPAVRALAFSHRQTVAVATSEGTIQFYEPGQSKPVMVSGHVGDVDSLCVNPEGTLLASGGQDGLINLWDLNTYQRLVQYSGHNRPVLQLQFSQDSKLLLSASGDYTTRIWELQSGLELRRYRERAAIVYSASFTCNPDIIVTASADKKLRFYKISSGRLVGAVESDNQYLRSVVCDRNHPVVASAGGDGLIRVWRFLV
jgi:serine/threonine protein kinase